MPNTPPSSSRRRLAIGVALAGLTLTPAVSLAQSAPMDETMREKLTLARALSDVFKRAADTIEPSVVHITTQRQQTVRRMGMRPQTILRDGGLGSGIVLTDDGYILTNNHVIEGAARLAVRLADQRELDAELVGRDPNTDLAVLKVDASSLTPARFAHIPVEVGEWVLAAGSPFGLTSSVTAGIVSATGRTQEELKGNTTLFADFIQTDAAVNPGNSGGPLINLDGEVVGVNTAIFSRSGGSNGISFAIPAAIAERVIGDLIQRGEVTRGWLGVTFNTLTPDIAERLDIDADRGIYINTVNSGSPAERSGLRPGDVITEINGRQVDDDDRFRTLIGLGQPGESLPARLIRDGRPVTLDLTIGDQRSERERLLERRAADTGAVAIPHAGLIVAPIERDRARSIAGDLDLDERPGAAIAFVDPELAENTRFRIGDIITRVDRTRVEGPEQFARLFEDAQRVYLIRFDRFGGAMQGYVPLGDDDNDRNER
ncbi:MAG: trypsin-like peptidase domain-containing protein [Planctomycetota bacterium]